MTPRSLLMRRTSLMNNDTIAIMTQDETMTEFGDNGDFDDWLRLVNSPPEMLRLVNPLPEIDDGHLVNEASAPSEPVYDVQRTRSNRFNEERPDERITPERLDERTNARITPRTERMPRGKGGKGKGHPRDFPEWMPNRSSEDSNDESYNRHGNNNTRYTDSPNIKSPYPDNEKLIKTFGALFDRDFKWNGKGESYRDFIERFEDAIAQTNEMLLSIMKSEVVSGHMVDAHPFIEREYSRLSSLGATLLRKCVPSTIANTLRNECGHDFSTAYGKLQADFYSVNNTMLRQMANSVHKVEQLGENGDIRGEIEQMKATIVRLKANGRDVSDEDARDALFDLLPPSWDSWATAVERERSAHGSGLKKAHEVETDILARCLELDTKKGSKVKAKTTQPVQPVQSEWINLIDPRVADKIGVCSICFGKHPTAKCWGIAKCNVCGGPHDTQLHEYIKSAESNSLLHEDGDPNKTTQIGKGGKGGGQGGKGGGRSFGKFDAKRGKRPLYNAQVNELIAELAEGSGQAENEEEEDVGWHSMTNEELIEALNTDFESILGNVSVKMMTTEEKVTIYPTTIYPINRKHSVDEQACLDSGAGRHLFVSLAYFTEWDPDPVTIKVGGIVGEEVYCQKQGTVKFVNKGTNEVETIHHVMYVPEGVAKENIISETQWAADEDGYWFLTVGEERIFGKPGRAPSSCPKSGRHGFLHIAPLNSNTPLATSNNAITEYKEEDIDESNMVVVPKLIDTIEPLPLCDVCAPYVKEENGKVEVAGEIAGENTSDQVTVKLPDAELPYDLWKEARDHYLECCRVMATAASPTFLYQVLAYKPHVNAHSA